MTAAQACTLIGSEPSTMHAVVYLVALGPQAVRLADHTAVPEAAGHTADPEVAGHTADPEVADRIAARA